MDGMGQENMKLLIIGATGLVGRHVLEKALADNRITSIVAPGRRELGVHPKLHSPIVDFDCLPESAAWWQADSMICTLGTTIRVAGSQEAFRHVDYGYPLAAGRLAKSHGTPTFVLTSAIGANVHSRFFYNRVKGEVERDLTSIGFESLTFVRPGLIGGKRDEARMMETALGVFKAILDPVLPKRYRTNPAGSIAEKLLQAAISAQPGIHIVTSEEMV